MTQVENVKVAIRIRPFSKEELAENLNNIIDVSDNQITLNKPNVNQLSKIFTFDHIFQEKSTQIEVYRTVASPVVEKVLQGYNGTIFAYGQTGTGKTYTMSGHQMVPEERGIIPNTFGHIFAHISRSSEEKTFLVTATYLEIYNEEVRDLLSSNSNTKLEVRERSDIGVYVKNLVGFTVDSIESITDLMNRGNLNRTTKATLMNNVSSRSHAIFSIIVETKDLITTTMAKLNLVDLAGSERANRTQATGDRLVEASNINQSLSALGNVISALVDEKTIHVPYRNSKLTRLLQDSLGGNSKTAMIAMVSPSEVDYEESMCTLRYASRVKYIKNNVIINTETKGSLIESFEDEITRLQKRIAAITLHEERAMKLAKKKSGTTLEDCEKYDDELDALESEKNCVLEKIAVIQKKILVGGEELREKAQKQIFLLEESGLELADLDKSRQGLAEQIEEIGAAKIDMEKKYSSLQDEDKDLDEQIETVQKLLKEARDEYAEQEHDHQREIEILIYEYKTRVREMQLATKVTASTIPYEYLDKIEENTAWNEKYGDFVIMGLPHAGNNINKRPIVDKRSPVKQTEIDGLYYSYGAGRQVKTEDIKKKRS